MLFLTIYISIVAYLVLQGDILPNIVMFLSSRTSSVWWTKREFLMCILAVLLVPISSARSLKALRITSLISLVSMYFLAGIIVAKCVEGNVRTSYFI